MKSQHKPLLVFLASLLLLAAFIALPLTAQDTTDDTVIVVGPVVVADNGDILVGGYIIDPAGIFDPATVEEGDIVIITGELSGDGATIVAGAFEFFEDDPEVTETPDATDEQEVTETPEMTETPDDCTREGHPIATSLAEEFGVS